MKAVRCYGPEDVRLEEVARPEPGPGELLVQIKAAGVCRTDIEIITGSHGDYTSGRARVPITLGHEWSGVVAEVGPGVEAFGPGARVTGETGIPCGECRFCRGGRYSICPDVTETGVINRDGAMAECHVRPVSFTHAIGDLPFEQAALIEPATCAVYACHAAQVTPADRVLVTGGGSIGQLTAQAARVFGARFVAVTSRTPMKLKLARKLGADVALQPDRYLDEAARDATEGELFDVALECSSAPSAFGDTLRLTRPGGRIVVVGASHDWPAAPPPGLIVGKELSITGVRGSPNVWPETIALLQAGRLQVEPLITHRFPLEQYDRAFDLLKRSDPGVIKALLLPQPPL